MSRVSRMRQALNAKRPQEQVTDLAPIHAETARYAGLKIAVGIPAHDNVAFTFAFDWAHLMAYSIAALPDDVSVTIIAQPGTYVHSARQEIADTAVEGGFDYLLWLDADMRFPPDLLVRLLKRKKDVVGINYATRGIPSKFVAIKRIGWDGTGSERLTTTAESTGLEEVHGMGMGAVLMRVDVLRALPDPKKMPWFFFEWRPEMGQQVGEDIFFFRLLREHSYRVWVDHDLSKDCAHVGQWEYRCDHVQREEY